MYVFPPASLWKAGPWAEALRSALLYIYVLPEGNICLKSSYDLPNFFASCFFAYALSGRIILSLWWKLCLGTTFETWILLCLALSKRMFLPSTTALLTVTSLCSFQANMKSPPFPKSSLSTYSCLPWYSEETLTNSSLQLTFYGCVAIIK